MLMVAALDAPLEPADNKPESKPDNELSLAEKDKKLDESSVPEMDADDTSATGMLRLETRAVLGADESSSEFRIGVRTAPSTVRALLRRSDGAQDLVAVRETTGEVAIRAATLDRWETELVAGSQGIDVFLRENREHPVLARVLARGELERPAPAPSIRRGRHRYRYHTLKS